MLACVPPSVLVHTLVTQKHSVCELGPKSNSSPRRSDVDRQVGVGLHGQVVP